MNTKSSDSIHSDVLKEIEAKCRDNKAQEELAKKFKDDKLTRYRGYFIHKGVGVDWSYNNVNGEVFNQRIESTTRK